MIDEALAISLRAEGCSLREIAALLGYSVQRVSEICGPEQRPEVPKERIISLRKAGWSFRQIQKECGVSTTTVQKTLAEAGLQACA